MILALCLSQEMFESLKKITQTTTSQIRKVLKNSSIESEKALRDKVWNFIENWNKVDGHPFKWQFRGYINKAA